MSKIAIKELVIYLTLLVLFAFLMHPDLLESPSSRFSAMIGKQNYYHPLIYTFLIYLILYFLRFFISKVIILLAKLNK